MEKLGADINKAQTKLLMQWALITHLGVLDVTLGLAAFLYDSGHRLDVGVSVAPLESQQSLSILGVCCRGSPPASYSL